MRIQPRPFARECALPVRHWRFALTVMALAASGAVVLASTPAQPAFRPDHVYPIVTLAAIDALPQPLRDSFDRHRETLARDVSALAPGGPKDAHPERYAVWLDYAAPEKSDAAARQQAARTFPLDRAAARAKGYRSETFGELPFVLQDHGRDLTDALRTARWDAARDHAQRIILYSTMAAFPSQVTRGGTTSDTRALELWLVENIRPRLQHEVRVFPGRFERSADMRATIHAALRESLAAYFQLAVIDTAARGDAGLPADKGDLFAPNMSDGPAREYRRLLQTRAGDAACALFKNAALLAANLIGTAWMDAGSPEIPADLFAPRPVESPAQTSEKAGLVGTDGAAGKPGEALVAERFLGSASSETFHRASCQHAARIKTENTIRFATAKEAQRAGRKPCQTCKPGM